MAARRDVFQGLADPTRRDILKLLVTDSMNLNAIPNKFDMSRPTVSQHIKILTQCGSVMVKQLGCAVLLQ